MVSVIIPCRNAEPWIAETVTSALQHGCAEILLVDDGSTDRSNEIALDAGRGNLRVLPGERRGVSAARNVGMAAATQPWIQFLDADDVLGDGKIARQLAWGERTGADVVYGDFRELCEVARGEYRPWTRLWRDAAPLWHERGRIEGGGALLASPAGLHGCSVCATLLAAAPCADRTLANACRDERPAEGSHAVTLLPGVLVARYLGNSSAAAKAYFVRLWRRLRPSLAGRDAVEPRIWLT